MLKIKIEFAQNWQFSPSFDKTDGFYTYLVS